MAWVSCLVLSLALHAAALGFPVSFDRQSPIEVMRVSILPMEQESIGAGQAGMSAGPALALKPEPRASAGVGSTAAAPSTVHHFRRRPVSRAATSPTREEQSQTTRKIEPAPSADSEPQIVAGEAVPKVSDSSVAVVSTIRSTAETHDIKIAAPANVDSDVSGARATGTEMSGSDLRGAANGAGGIAKGATGLGLAGTGSGRKDGQGSTENGIALTRARYRDTPRPEYPESARREGREGRVLLRVLVDDQGRTRTVEIKGSSGSDALDRAAAEAIRRWRFHPARHGGRPVESWLRIPVEFRLADVKS
jgi:protein TonB